MKEFDFIRHYLHTQADGNIILGIGDDAAIIRPKMGWDLCASSDMLVADRHFFADVAPSDLAYKSLAVNLSDMAAMGATPRWVMLSVALPELNETWLNEFCASWFQTCQDFQVSLIGGDTTKGKDIILNVNIWGEVPQGLGLRRSAAQVGDDIWVSGQIGLAAAALKHHLQEICLPPALYAVCNQALLRPQPRVALGQGLLHIAHAAQDISDGLLQDLDHILCASQKGAVLQLEHIPTLPELKQHLNKQQWQECVLAGGDDYELLFTASPKQRTIIEQIAQQTQTPVNRIGSIVPQADGIRIMQKDHTEYRPNKKGFDHFGTH